MGGGSVARAKLQALREAGGAPRIVAAKVSEAFRREAEGLELHERPFSASDLDGIQLVVSATNDPAANAAIAAEARARGIWVNAVDDPAACDVTFAATLRRGPLTLAFSTSGAFPGLSKSLRRAFETLLPVSDELPLRQLAEFRRRLRVQLPNPERRAAALRTLLAEFERIYLPGATP
ncbi:MAG TPA: bifunctional precorrin-2 dehydrogenase/sirohydrochlorin ferrochelatase [Holophagaceae bacterium]|nr:bifunctional precorrin-2 dehydrogenase/sirohydrochlorin ferrochelatase [Holophagaceae bacterium]